ASADPVSDIDPRAAGDDAGHDGDSYGRIWARGMDTPARRIQHCVHHGVPAAVRYGPQRGIVFRKCVTLVTAMLAQSTNVRDKIETLCNAPAFSARLASS